MKLFYLLPPCSRSLNLLLNERHTLFPKSSFFTAFGGSPFLVLLGGRLTVLGHNLGKYKSSAILIAGRQPKES